MSKYKKLYREIVAERKHEDEGGAEYVECEYEGCEFENKRIYVSQLATYNFSHVIGKRLHDPYDKKNVKIVHAYHHVKHHIGGFKTEIHLPLS